AIGGSFSQTNNCPAALGIGLSCTINVVFTPTLINANAGTLTVTDDASLGVTQSVILTGQGLPLPAPAASLSSTSLTFSSQFVGSASAAQSFTITNVGGSPLVVSNVSISAEYSQTNDCPASLAVSARCTFNITFTPAQEGTRPGTLTITDNGVNSPHTV